MLSLQQHHFQKRSKITQKHIKLITVLAKISPKQISSSIRLLFLRLGTITLFWVCGPVYMNYIMFYDAILCEFFNWSTLNSCDFSAVLHYITGGCWWTALHRALLQCSHLERRRIQCNPGVIVSNDRLSVFSGNYIILRPCSQWLGFCCSLLFSVVCYCGQLWAARLLVSPTQLPVAVGCCLFSIWEM